VKVAFDSGEEAIAIAVYNKRRKQKLSEALIIASSNVGDRKQANDFIKEYRGELFVEYEYDSQKFLVNSRKVYEKVAKRLAGINLITAGDPSAKKKGPVSRVNLEPSARPQHARRK
jgi:hypothetical protein